MANEPITYPTFYSLLGVAGLTMILAGSLLLYETLMAELMDMIQLVMAVFLLIFGGLLSTALLAWFDLRKQKH